MEVIRNRTSGLEGAKMEHISARTHMLNNDSNPYVEQRLEPPRHQPTSLYESEKNNNRSTSCKNQRGFDFSKVCTEESRVQANFERVNKSTDYFRIGRIEGAESRDDLFGCKDGMSHLQRHLEEFGYWEINAKH